MALGSVSSLGVGSGFELQKMLTDLRAADETSLNIKKAKKTRMAEQVVEFDSINAKMLQMKSDALSLSLASNFLERKVSIDDQVAAAGVQSGTALSSYDLTIDRLASKSSWQATTGVAGPGFIVPDLGFSYGVGAGSDPVYVTIPPGTSYEQLVSLINNDANNGGIKAAMINTGIGATPWHLTFTANETGENSRITLNGGIAMTEIQGNGGAGSLNSAFSIDGFGYQRQNNSNIDDIIQGVSLSLKKIDSTQITISSSADSLKEKIINLIDVYNEINQEIDLKTSYAGDPESEDGIFSNIHALKTLDSVLADLLGTLVNTGGTIKSLADLGMQTNRNGTITLDKSILDQAFSSSLDEVAALFLGDKDKGIKGLGDTLNEKLRSMTHSSTGIVNAEKSTVQIQIDNLTDSIEVATLRLDKKYDQMARQFIQLDSFIGKMNSQADYLSSMLDSFNNSNKAK